MKKPLQFLVRLCETSIQRVARTNRKSEPIINGDIKSGRLRSLGHVERMPAHR